MKKLFLSLIICVTLISSLYIVTNTPIQNAVQAQITHPWAAERYLGGGYNYAKIKLEGTTLKTTSNLTSYVGIGGYNSYYYVNKNTNYEYMWSSYTSNFDNYWDNNSQTISISATNSSRFSLFIDWFSCY